MKQNKFNISRNKNLYYVNVNAIIKNTILINLNNCCKVSRKFVPTVVVVLKRILIYNNKDIWKNRIKILKTKFKMNLIIIQQFKNIKIIQMNNRVTTNKIIIYLITNCNMILIKKIKFSAISIVNIINNMIKIIIVKIEKMFRKKTILDATTITITTIIIIIRITKTNTITINRNTCTLTNSKTAVKKK